MAMYPDVARSMREEVLLSHGKDGTPTYDSLRSLKYSVFHFLLMTKVVDVFQ